MDRSRVEAEAKKLLEKFGAALKQVSVDSWKGASGEEMASEIEGVREEGEGNEADPEFRKLFFANAPKVDGEFIVAEKKKWQ
ncbi:hypothetical protein D6817_00790 [Candidatus Pacearchaeota archaeon]|nr:MAG: hypothetical protein D6817_00790 [Candidatus Pacearchaeota archaeon]